MRAGAAIVTEPWWWQAAPRPSAAPGPLPARTDVAVVGGGYTGVSAALTLARAGRSVTILEAGAAGAGASTRNGGMIGSGHRVGYTALARRFGERQAVALLSEGANALRFTTALIEREGIDCHFRRCGRFRAAWSPGDYDAMARELELLRRHVGVAADMLPRTEQHQELSTERYHGGCLYHEHGGLHPGLLFDGLLARALAAGAALHAHTPVLALERGADTTRVVTAGGSLVAREVLIASNGYTGAATPALARRVVPVPSYIAVTGPLQPELLRRLIPGGRMIVETRARHCYYRQVPDAPRLLLGARAALRQIDPLRAAPVLHGLLQGIFPELAGVNISHTWKGNVAMTRSQLPHSGQRDGVYYALGCNGSGVAMAPYLGHKLALRVLGAAEGHTAFESLPFPALPLYRGRPWFLALLDPYWRWRDWRERRA